LAFAAGAVSAGAALGGGTGGGVPKQMSQEVRLPVSPPTQSQIVSVQLPVAAGTLESATLSMAKLPLVYVPKFWEKVDEG
jgi:hypothetical protein